RFALIRNQNSFFSICVNPSYLWPLFLERIVRQRIYDLPKLVFAEGLQCLRADIALCTEAEHTLSVSFVIGRVDHADQIIATHRRIGFFDFHSCLLEGLPAGIKPPRTTLDCRNTFFRPLQQCNVSWHGVLLV